jgi:hypothetical protein
MATPPRDIWPALPLAEWEDTYKTLHMWTQIVGKVRLAHAPHLNHWWQIALHVTPRGLRMPSTPYADRQFEIAFDFVDHRLVVQDSTGGGGELELRPRSVAAFYRELMALLERCGLATAIWPMPVEVPNPIRFPDDEVHAAYDPAAVTRLHRILRSAHDELERFRGEFVGKCSPVHFFWGAFDLAVTRFSGRRNPDPPTDRVMGEGYSHEVVSHGFWPGGDWPVGGRLDGAAFYAYAAPEPHGFRDARGLPAAARYDERFNEYLLPYEAMRATQDPTATLRAFLRATYAAGADAAGWDRAALEVAPAR